MNSIGANVPKDDRKRDTDRRNEFLAESVAFVRQFHQRWALLNDTIIDTIIKTGGVTGVHPKRIAVHRGRPLTGGLHYKFIYDRDAKDALALRSFAVTLASR